MFDELFGDDDTGVEPAAYEDGPSAGISFTRQLDSEFQLPDTGSPNATTARTTTHPRSEVHDHPLLKELKVMVVEFGMSSCQPLPAIPGSAHSRQRHADMLEHLGGPS